MKSESVQNSLNLSMTSSVDLARAVVMFLISCAWRRWPLMSEYKQKKYTVKKKKVCHKLFLSRIMCIQSKMTNQGDTVKITVTNHIL